jgi:hypothetical protein
MLVWIFVGLIVATALYLFVIRKEAARAQSLLAGGTVGVGCVFAEIATLLFLAALVVVADLLGAFSL